MSIARLGYTNGPAPVAGGWRVVGPASSTNSTCRRRQCKASSLNHRRRSGPSTEENRDHCSDHPRQPLCESLDAEHTFSVACNPSGICRSDQSARLCVSAEPARTRLWGQAGKPAASIARIGYLDRAGRRPKSSGQTFRAYSGKPGTKQIHTTLRLRPGVGPIGQTDLRPLVHGEQGRWPRRSMTGAFLPAHFSLRSRCT